MGFYQTGLVVNGLFAVFRYAGKHILGGRSVAFEQGGHVHLLQLVLAAGVYHLFDGARHLADNGLSRLEYVIELKCCICYFFKQLLSFLGIYVNTIQCLIYLGNACISRSAQIYREIYSVICHNFVCLKKSIIFAA